MTKKSLNKLLSVILALAICFTTVYGCLISASAATGCYSWSDGEVAEDLKSATINLTITAPDSIDKGVNDMLMNVASESVMGDTLVLDSAEIVGGTLKSSGEALSADQYAKFIENGAIHIFASPTEDEYVIEDYLVSSITLKLSFSFAEGTGKMGNKYYAKLTQLELTDGFNGGDEYIEGTFTAKGLMNAGCDHVFDVTGLTPDQTNDIDGYYVYTNVPCANNCGVVNEYQVVPATELKNVLYWNGDTAEPTTTDSAGNKLITSAAELAWVTSNTVNGNYKIADGIDAIVLQSSAHAAVLDFTDFEQTKAYFDAAIKANTVTVWKNGGKFQGTFDGNGVEIYGMYCKTGTSGLFSTVNVSENSSTIKNIAVKNSYVLGTDTSAALVGKAVAAYSADYGVKEATAKGYINFEKIVIANCYIFNNWLNNQGNRLGVMLASAATFVNVSMDSCLVYGNDIKGYYKRVVPTDGSSAFDTSDTVDGGLFGILSGGHNGANSNGLYTNGKYSNSIILDCLPYYADQDKISAYNITAGGNANMGRANHAFRPDFFSNIYTNCTSEYTPTSIAGWYTWSNYAGKIITIDKKDVKGTAAADIVSKLGGDWQVDELGGYPKFVDDAESLKTKTDTWFGDSSLAKYSSTYTVPDSETDKRMPYNTYNLVDAELAGSGTPADPYIITSAEELAFVTRGGRGDTAGKYYKVADDVKAFYLNAYLTQNGGSTAWVDENAPFESVLNTFKGDWVDKNSNKVGNNFAHTGTGYRFEGNFDGNGVTIYGLWNGAKGNAVGYAALFPYVKGDVTIKNINIKKACLYSDNYAGAIVGQSERTNDTAEGSLTIENCSVTESYITCYVSSTPASAGGAVTYGVGAIFGRTSNSYSYRATETDETGDLNGDSKIANGEVTVYVNGKVNIKNCFVDLDKENLFATKNTSGTYAHRLHTSGLGAVAGTNAVKFTNCVVLGVTPYAVADYNSGNNDIQHTGHTSRFSNVYTDQAVGTVYVGGTTNNGNQTFTAAQIQKISPSDVKGIKAKSTLQGFDFANVWSYDGNGGYPTPVADAIPTTSQFNLNLLGTNIDYNTNGTFNFNFYYEDVDGIGAPTLYVGRADGNGFSKLSGTKLEAGVAANDRIFKNAGIELGTTPIYKYTITNISAREMGDTLLPTAVATNGKSTVYGKTEAISISKYANEIIANVNATDTDKQVAAALVNYGTAAADVLKTGNTVASKTVYWSGTTGAHPTKQENGVYIIETAEQLHYLANNATLAETTGNKYKIADDIAVMVLQPEETVNNAGGLDKLMGLADTDAVYDYFKSGKADLKVWVTKSNEVAFNGSFDGNGVTIYGLYADGTKLNVGLFPVVDAGGTNSGSLETSVEGTYYKNVTVKNSYLETMRRMGMFGSLTMGDSGGAKVKGVIRISGCEISNCYMYCNSLNTYTRTVDGVQVQTYNVGINENGILIGAPNDIVQVNNCLIYGNKNQFREWKNKVGNYYSVDNNDPNDPSTYNLVDFATNNNWMSPITDEDGIQHKISITNTIVLGAKLNTGCYSKDGYFRGVYTDFTSTNHTAADYTTYGGGLISESDIIGKDVETICSTLGWGVYWNSNVNGAPTLIQNEIEGGIIGWNGTQDSNLVDLGESGTEADPIIIDSVEELAYLVNGAGYTYTFGKYFKVADGIDKMVLQKRTYADDIIALATPEAVKLYFEDANKIASPTLWTYTGYNSNHFAGNFDGNGVKIYGLYSKDTSGNRTGALFPVVNGCTVSNLTVTNSYYNHAVNTSIVNYNFGGIVGNQGSRKDANDESNVVWLKQCTFTNNYIDKITDAYNKSGTLAGAFANFAVIIKDCLVYDNDVTCTNKNASAAYDMPILGYANNAVTPTSDFQTKYPDYCTINPYIDNMVVNTVVFDSALYNISVAANRFMYPDCYENVYTDQEIVGNASWSAEKYAAKITKVEKQDLLGANAKNVLASSMLAENGGVWYPGNEFDGLPGFKPAGAMPTAIQQTYDNLSLSVYDDYGASDDKFGIYNTNINLKNNPYMGITFVIGGKYRDVRDEVDITISIVNSDGTKNTIRDADAMRLPEYVSGQYISDPNGWTNKKGAGSYHLYALRDLPITDMCKSIEITMSYSGDAADEKSVTAVIGVEGFALDRQNQYLTTGNDYHAKCAEAAKALLYYVQVLKAALVG